MNDIKKTEDLLTQFSRKPSPDGLRTKVLENADRKRELNRLISPALLKAALISGIVAAAFLIIDAGLEGSQKKRLATLTGHSRIVPQEWDYQGFLLDEVVIGDSNASWALFRLRSGKKAREKESKEAREKLLRREINEY